MDPVLLAAQALLLDRCVKSDCIGPRLFSFLTLLESMSYTRVCRTWRQRIYQSWRNELPRTGIPLRQPKHPPAGGGEARGSTWIESKEMRWDERVTGSFNADLFWAQIGSSVAPHPHAAGGSGTPTAGGTMTMGSMGSGMSMLSMGITMGLGGGAGSASSSTPPPTTTILLETCAPSLLRLASKFGRVDSLSFAYCHRLSDNLLLAVIDVLLSRYRAAHAAHAEYLTNLAASASSSSSSSSAVPLSYATVSYASPSISFSGSPSSTASSTGVLSASLAAVPIRTLNLFYCRTISDECVRLICERLPHLVEVNLGHCGELTDRAMAYLGGLRELRRLHTECLTKLTEDTMMMMEDPRVFPVLEIWNLQGSSRKLREYMDDLRRARPTIRIKGPELDPVDLRERKHAARTRATHATTDD